MMSADELESTRADLKVSRGHPLRRARGGVERDVMKLIFSGVLAAALLLSTAPASAQGGATAQLHPTLEFYSPEAQAQLLPPGPYAPRDDTVARWLLDFRPPPPHRGEAYILSGFPNEIGILLPSSGRHPINVYQSLADQGINFSVGWWNSLDRGDHETAGPLPDPVDDRRLVSELVELINQLPSGHKLILIGHSFGADSLLKVAEQVTRSIDLLAVIDPVAAYALRRTVVRRPVPPRVRYFWNRWQQRAPWPLDFLRSGRIPLSDPSQTYSDQREVKEQGFRAHSQIQSNRKVQRELIEAIKRAVADPPASPAH